MASGTSQPHVVKSMIPQAQLSVFIVKAFGCHVHFYCQFYLHFDLKQSLVLASAKLPLNINLLAKHASVLKVIDPISLVPRHEKQR